MCTYIVGPRPAHIMSYSWIWNSKMMGGVDLYKTEDFCAMKYVVNALAFERLIECSHTQILMFS